jgi:hypothetical protein
MVKQQDKSKGSGLWGSVFIFLSFFVMWQLVSVVAQQFVFY